MSSTRGRFRLQCNHGNLWPDISSCIDSKYLYITKSKDDVKWCQLMSDYVLLSAPNCLVVDWSIIPVLVHFTHFPRLSFDWAGCLKQQRTGIIRARLAQEKPGSPTHRYWTGTQWLSREFLVLEGGKGSRLTLQKGGASRGRVLS